MTKDKLIDDLIRDGYLKTPPIIEAFRKIDRADFVLPEHVPTAYVNAPLPIGEGQTISQPLTVAFMLELLEPKEGEKILDIGAGSGWTAALLAEIVGDPPDGGGKVIAIERIQELKEVAEANVSKYGFTEKGIVKIIQGNGVNGYKDEAPYDKIIAAAAASRIPRAWKSQLKIGGRIVAPVSSSIVMLRKIDQDRFEKKEYFGFAFVPLIGG
ncbi:MAG: protein-L-isoaspartate O-methyltransferase [Candidatus Jorgensenbacteria bacterium]